jgi:O-acetylserine/cysteine efflux transporter
MPRASLSPIHAALAVLVMAIWGTNFVVIKLGLASFPPLTFAALRFVFAALPAVFFFRRPAVPLWSVAAYGLFIGVGQFGLLYIAMQGLISPGLASLVVQVQAFFTIGLSMAFTGERLKGFQLAALALAAAGLAWLIAHGGADARPLGVVLVMAAALSWAAGNTVQRAVQPARVLPFVVWSSLFAAPPLIGLALVVDGWDTASRSLVHAGPGAWAAVVWQSVGNTLFGYGVWAWLLARHPAAVIAPMALLVPVFGMAASAALLGEPLADWKLTAAGLVLAGLAINTFWPAWRRRGAAAAPTG